MIRPQHLIRATVAAALCAWLLAGCGTLPEKKYFLLNYLPSPMAERLNPAPYPCVLRLKELEIEAAYARPQIVYRQSPFELQYDYYRSWAVKPAQMVTDLIYKHLQSANLVGVIVRRFDEGLKPDFEIAGNIEAIEEYDSDKAWFAHVALRLEMTRVRDGHVLYSKRFDNRKQVYQNQPDLVIKDLSAIIEFMMNQAIRDMDVVLSHESGYNRIVVPQAPDTATGTLGPSKTEGTHETK